MISKYLAGDPVPWLVEEADPSVRYLTLRDILYDETADKEYNNLYKSEEIKTLFKMRRNGIFGNRKNYDIFYRGAMWCFAEAVERGLDRRSDVVDETALFIVNKSQMISGGFTLNWKPEVEDARTTGDMVRYLVFAGYDDERTQKGIKWIVENQRHDGGWLYSPITGMCDTIKLMLFRSSGKGITREGKNDINSCFHATIACSLALVHYYKRDSLIDESIKKAAEFFLNNRLFIKQKKDFELLGYPIISFYDILNGLFFIAKAGYFNDSRTGEAFNLIMSKQNNDGTWNLETARSGMMFGNMGRGFIGKKNKWITLKILKLLKLAENFS